MKKVSWFFFGNKDLSVIRAHGRRSLRKSRGDKNRFPLDREIVLKIAKNSFTVVIVDKGLCNVSAVRFYQEIMNGHDRS